MNGGKYIPPNRKRLADDLLDKAEARETESLKDVLIRLARQKKSGSIVLDGRKSISKLPMVNFLFHCADGAWLIECVASNAVRGRRCCTTSPLVSRASRSPSAQRSDVGKHMPTWIHCAKRNRLGPERAAKLTCVHYNMRLRQAREDPTFEPVCLPQMVLDPIDAEADDFDEGSESD